MASPDEIRAVVARCLKVEPERLQAETVLRDLPEYDSLELLLLLLALEDIGLAVSQEQAAQLRTFGDILALNKS